MPCTGFIRLAAKDVFGMDTKADKLKFIELKKTIDVGLRQRLENINVPNVDEVIKYMIKELEKVQSLIVMRAI